MISVKVKIDKKIYSIACNPTEQQVLINLAKQLNDKIISLRNNLGAIGIDQIMVIAALTLTQEIDELNQQNKILNTTINNLQKKELRTSQNTQKIINNIEKKINTLYTRIEKILNSITNKQMPKINDENYGFFYK